VVDAVHRVWSVSFARFVRYKSGHYCFHPLDVGGCKLVAMRPK
jgi:hypothetical protein